MIHEMILNAFVDWALYVKAKYLPSPMFVAPHLQSSITITMMKKTTRHSPVRFKAVTKLLKYVGTFHGIASPIGPMQVGAKVPNVEIIEYEFNKIQSNNPPKVA